MDVTTDEIVSLANDVGLEYSRSYPGIEREDISQAALTAFYENIKDAKGKTKPWIRTALAKAAKRYCNKERADYLYYSSQYVYTPKDVRALLEVAYTSGYDSHSTPKKGDKDNVLDAGSVVISVFDLTTALGKLNKDSLDLLDRKETGHELTGAELRRYYRTVDALVGFLNRHLNSKERVREHEGPGKRRVITNANARAITANHGVDERGEKPSVDTVTGTQTAMSKAHPLSVRSRHVVNSPWRKSD